MFINFLVERMSLWFGIGDAFFLKNILVGIIK